MFTSLPRASTYQLVLRYANVMPTSSLAPIATVMQGGQVFTPRFIIDPDCVPPCHASSVNVFINEISGLPEPTLAEFDLNEGPVTVTMQLSSIDILVVSPLYIPPVSLCLAVTVTNPSTGFYYCCTG